MNPVSGFLRSSAVAAVTLMVPAVWAAAVAIALWWGSPWAAIGPLVWACIGTVLLLRPAGRMARALIARWTGAVIEPGYREPGPVARMSTGYWWNGFSYSRTNERAREEQEWRVRLTDPANVRDLRFVTVAAIAGVAAAVPIAGMAFLIAGIVRWQPVVIVLGAVVAVAASPFAWRPFVPIATAFLRPTSTMLLASRVDELTAQRADTTVAQAAEIRRIERDLHDGAQAGLVALGLSLATAEKLMETDPERARGLLRSARAGAASSLEDLRDLVRGISPPVLSERGLPDAIRAVALDSPLDVRVDADPALRLDPPIESALYFGVAELLTNAVKHAHATHARVRLNRDDTAVTAEVEDDGRGGAEMRPGGGLAGLRRRIAAFDGTVEILSPPGGPTRARMVVPCESS